MPLPAPLLAVLDDPKRDRTPWRTLFYDAQPMELFEGWRRGFGAEHPEPPPSDLLGIYLSRHVRFAEPTLAFCSKERPPWPVSADGPWPTDDEKRPEDTWLQEDAPVGVLLAMGAAISTTASVKRNGHDVLDMALEKGWTRVVRQILARPDCPTATELAQRQAPEIARLAMPRLPWAHLLALTGRTGELIDWLAKPGMDPNQRDRDGRTPLFYAMKTDVIDALLTAGADPNAVDNVGLCPQQLWLRPTRFMQEAINRRGQSPMAEREAWLGIPSVQQRTAVLFAKLEKADNDAILLAQSLSEDEADWRLHKNLPSGRGPGAWGPLAYIVVERLIRWRSSSINGAIVPRDTVGEENLLRWAHALNQPTAPKATRRWLAHETLPGVPDCVLLTALAAISPHYRHWWPHSLDEENPDTQWSALSFLADATSGDGRKMMLRLLTQSILAPALSTHFPDAERRVALRRLADLWASATGRGFFNAHFKDQLGTKTGLGADQTLTLLAQDPALASTLLLVVARMPEGEGLSEAERWVKRGLRPLPGEPTEKFRMAWKKNPAGWARVQTSLMEQSLAATPAPVVQPAPKRWRM